MGTVIMLSGPVGAGKSTVATELVALLPAPVARIEGDAFWSCIAKPGDRERREDFKVILRAMTVASLPFARSGYNVVLDFSIPPDFLPVARKILKEVPLDFVLLRPSLAVCEARAAARAVGAITDYAQYRNFHALFDNPSLRAISDDESDAARIASRVRDGLAHGIFRVA